MEFKWPVRNEGVCWKTSVLTWVQKKLAFCENGVSNRKGVNPVVKTCLYFTFFGALERNYPSARERYFRKKPTFFKTKIGLKKNDASALWDHENKLHFSGLFQNASEISHGEQTINLEPSIFGIFGKWKTGDVRASPCLRHGVPRESIDLSLL